MTITKNDDGTYAIALAAGEIATAERWAAAEPHPPVTASELLSQQFTDRLALKAEEFRIADALAYTAKRAVLDPKDVAAIDAIVAKADAILAARAEEAAQAVVPEP